MEWSRSGPDGVPSLQSPSWASEISVGSSFEASGEPGNGSSSDGSGADRLRRPRDTHQSPRDPPVASLTPRRPAGRKLIVSRSNGWRAGSRSTARAGTLLPSGGETADPGVACYGRMRSIRSNLQLAGRYFDDGRASRGVAFVSRVGTHPRVPAHRALAALGHSSVRSSSLRYESSLHDQFA